jgi:hypothetical protein
MFGHGVRGFRDGHGHGESKRRGGGHGRHAGGRPHGGPFRHSGKDAEAGMGTGTFNGAGGMETLAPKATAGVGTCPLCDKHCPLDAPSCGKGRRMAARRVSGE